MAPKAEKSRKKKPEKGTQLFARPLGNTERLGYGLALMVVGLILLVSVVSYYFTWSADQVALHSGAAWSGLPEMHNSIGKIGAWFGDLMVGRWFGVMGIGIPAMLIILALRMFMDRRLWFGKSVRITFLVMILGSLTLGCLFGSAWGVFGTGLGGELGVVSARWLESYIGKVGLVLVLILLWILLAIYINRRTVAVMNRMGDSITRKATGLLDRRREKEQLGRQEQPEAVRPRKPVEEEVVFETIDQTDIDRDLRYEEPDEDIVRDEDQYQQEVEQAYTPFDEKRGEDEELEVFDPFASDQTPESVEEEGNIYDDLEDDDFVVMDTEGNKVKASTLSGRKPATLGAGGVVVSSEEEGMQIVIAESHDAEADEIELDLYDPTRELRHYQRPPVDILEDHSTGIQISEDEIRANKTIIREKLGDFGIKINDRIKATIGPTVTLYEIEPAQGVKISRIRNLEEDIALALKVQSIRIMTLGAGRGTVGIEVPNSSREVVSMYSVIKSAKFQECQYRLPIALGKTIYNEIYIGDLAKMPHLLVAGATGQGKSVGLNAIITSLLYKKHPSELKFVLVDPKQVELSVYAKLEKHFLAKMESEDNAILTDTQKVVYTLNSLVNLMEERYTLLNKAGERNIADYNDKFLKRRLNPNNGHHFMPYIVVVIDEFADMIMTAGKEVEVPITRLAAKARAIGIHLIVATQRPDVKVITGLIKSNIPARVAFKVVSMVDSRTIIDQPGANNLIGIGDMLLSLNGDLTRIQCAFVDTPEIERLTDFIGDQKGYPEPYPLPDYVPDDGGITVGRKEMGRIDDMFEEVAQFVVQNQSGSTSAIQRRFEIGYNRAGRIMDQLESAGVVGRSEGGKPREVLVYDLSTLERILAELGV